MSTVGPVIGRRRKAWNWVLAHPTEVATLGTVATLVILGVVTLFVPNAMPFLLASFAAVLSALTVLVIVDRNSIHDARTAMSAVAEAVGRVESVTESILARTSIREIAPDIIGAELTRLLGGASEWRFRGGSARWQRTHVLPALAKFRDRDVPYQALILSPFDAALCGRYAEYRSRSREPEKVDGESVQRDLLSFIYAAAVWARTSRIVPEIGLITTYSPLRVDGSADAMVVTVADKSRAALRAEADGWYFVSLKDEFNLHKQTSPLSLPAAEPMSDANNVKAVSDFFSALLAQNSGLDPLALASFDDERWSDVLTRAFPNGEH